MALYDRQYAKDKFNARPYDSPLVRLGLPGLSPVVAWLLAINIAVFIVMAVLKRSTPRLTIFLIDFFTVYPSSLIRMVEVWRWVTYQFLHADFWHILWNMLLLLFFGPQLERWWGSRRFLFFYLGCGVAGAVFYTLLVALGYFKIAAPMLGASGSILGVLAACAILFPHTTIFLFFVPMPIRVGALLLIFISAASILSRTRNAGGEAAHLAGMVAGAFYVLLEPMRMRANMRMKSATWGWRRKREQKLQKELDRILEKVHNAGLHSLSFREKRVLRKATQAEQSRR